MKRIKSAIGLLFVVAAACLAQGCSKAETKFVGTWKESESGEVLELFKDRTLESGGRGQTVKGEWEPLGDGKLKMTVKEGGVSITLEGRLDGDALLFEVGEGDFKQTVRFVRLSADDAKAAKSKMEGQRYRSRCLNGQRQVREAVEMWAMENNVAGVQPVEAAEVLSYLKDNTLPRCPQTDTPIAVPAKVGDPVVCPSNPEHNL